MERLIFQLTFNDGGHGAKHVPVERVRKPKS
jgi:hypothetical protein